MVRRLGEKAEHSESGRLTLHGSGPPRILLIYASLHIIYLFIYFVLNLAVTFTDKDRTFHVCPSSLPSWISCLGSFHSIWRPCHRGHPWHSCLHLPDGSCSVRWASQQWEGRHAVSWPVPGSPAVEVLCVIMIHSLSTSIHIICMIFVNYVKK